MQWCERAARTVLPAIRREAVRVLVSMGKSRKEAARILGVTPAAVSQYLKGKRAKVELTPEEKEEIARMVKEGKESELCELCKRVAKRMEGG